LIFPEQKNSPFDPPSRLSPSGGREPFQEGTLFLFSLKRNRPLYPSFSFPHSGIGIRNPFLKAKGGKALSLDRVDASRFFPFVLNVIPSVTFSLFRCARAAFPCDVSNVHQFLSLAPPLSVSPCCCCPILSGVGGVAFPC